jgi:hypothetical protein
VTVASARVKSRSEGISACSRMKRWSAIPSGSQSVPASSRTSWTLPLGKEIILIAPRKDSADSIGPAAAAVAAINTISSAAAVFKLGNVFGICSLPSDTLSILVICLDFRATKCVLSMGKNKPFDRLRAGQRHRQRASRRHG